MRQAKDHEKGQLRLSHQVWWAQYNHAQGQKLSNQRDRKEISFWDLEDWQRQLVEDYDCGRTGKALQEALQKKAFRGQPYRGAGKETETT